MSNGRLELALAAAVVVSLAFVWAYSNSILATGNAVVGCILAWGVGKRQGKSA